MCRFWTTLRHAVEYGTTKSSVLWTRARYVALHRIYDRAIGIMRRRGSADPPPAADGSTLSGALARYEADRSGRDVAWERNRRHPQRDIFLDMQPRLTSTDTLHGSELSRRQGVEMRRSAVRRSAWSRLGPWRRESADMSRSNVRSASRARTCVLYWWRTCHGHDAAMSWCGGGSYGETGRS